MANEEQLSILRQGEKIWNQWRLYNFAVPVDFSSVDLSGTDLFHANLRNVDFSSANLSNANLSMADLTSANMTNADLRKAVLNSAKLRGAKLRDAKLREANLIDTELSGADLSGADLRRVPLFNADLREANLCNADLKRAFLFAANLSGAKLIGADLKWADLRGANLSGTDLSGADLSGTSLIGTDFTKATLFACRVFGISAWDVKLDGAIQSDLVITDVDEPEIRVDNLEVAQFIYLLLNNQKLRDVIDTIGKKAVLILGRFTLPERKEVLEIMRSLLRERGLLPIVFDFEKSEERDFTETIKVLTGMCLFVIADITNPKSTPLELQGTVPDYMIPFAPIIQEGENPFAMFVDLQHKYRWVLPVRRYRDVNHLRDNFEHGIITPALQRHKELILLKNETLKIKNIDE